ncbi:phosphoribosylamine--glycine ligase [Desulfovibrio sulfodismutans]|uniref:Phosphoribosylamine--glycine ligase n=1 Tax=Desulfolutivibrio sulfodismutans TaxID=63561 RepID=A0A7K3NPY0_9BACT|nr:phosphoribosylamine--glycine ligase [Desulfolutivibrio sulfodismutans]NDY58266.1 phosphoribosylamine--glycine ligase [Desulfolutivibrio sulfodismutans]QLA14157.1 phosphoribosylamine--glycine ligase [Desulfolutivibrio sulfodismutans DSM 3696]
MRVLLVGSGGREHALAVKLRQSPGVTELFIAPGNGGTAEMGQNVPLADSDVAGLAAFARETGVELVVAGPELPLTLGLSDAMAEAGIPCFGPDRFAAGLEGSKAFAKEIMREAGVPTADFRAFTDPAAACAYIEAKGAPLVVKADGLAAGKGVVVAGTVEEAKAAVADMMVKKIFGPAGETVIVEEALSGEEASFLAFCDGERCVPLSACQDHKAAFDGDTGPNTGGMGAYCPAPILPESEYGRMADRVIVPIMRTLAAKGHPFRGVLYAGLMMTDKGPMVLEYNVRFGDPECQPLLMRLRGDLAEILLACATGSLNEAMVGWSRQSAVCVVMAASGYPGNYPKGMEITGIEAAQADPEVTVFQAGTRRDGERLVTSGGRVLGVTALGADLARAKARAYAAVAKIHFDNAVCRSDIGDKGLRREAKT